MLTTSDMAKNPYLRGSEWRKWDLHVHSPESALANEFNGDWNSYLTALKQLTDVAVLGVTDYFSIDGYRKLLKHRAEITNIPLLLPNIELRLNTLVGKDERRLNYHVIFSDEVSPDIIEEYFLGEIKVQTGGDPRMGSTTTNLKRKSIEELGARLKREHSTFNGSDFTVGCTNVTVNPEEVTRVLREQRERFSGRHLLVLAEEGTSEMSWDGQHHLTRKNLILTCHALFTANKNNVMWLLGRKSENLENFIAEFGRPRPAYHGSDAHKVATICRPDLDRHCWIKADPTFNGLKQTTYEPAERVSIGPEKPNRKPKYQTIDSISIEGVPFWFGEEQIYLNPDLVAIIGGRGSGKSAMAEMVAFAGGSSVFATGDVRDYFLKKAMEKSSSNLNPIIGAKITLRWADGKVDVVEVNTDTLSRPKEQEKVKYLPQKFVERLCAPEHTSDLQQEIEHVVFQNLPSERKTLASNFAELRNAMTSGISVQRADIAVSIQDIFRDIAQLEAKLSSRPSLERTLEQKRSEHTALLSQPPSIPEEMKTELSELQRLNALSQQLQGEIAVLEQMKNNLATLEARTRSMVGQINTYNNEISQLAKAAGIETEVTKFTATAPNHYEEVLLARRQGLEAEIQLRRDVPGDSSTNTLASVDQQRAQVSARLKFEETKQREYERFLDTRGDLENSIRNIERDLQLIAKEVAPRLTQKADEFTEKYVSLIDLLIQERQVLESLYKPLSDALASSDQTARKLSFVSLINFDSEGASHRLFEMMDGRSSLHSQDELTFALRSFATDLDAGIESAQGGSFDRTVATTAIASLRSRLTVAFDGKAKSLEKQLKNGVTRQDFDNELFNPKWFSSSYRLLFDGKPLNLLSPGERGVVLLLLYLEAERSDLRPLVIDQPEDNLDNMSVFPDLVDYFRKRKQERQIIIVTHNPNLVVNTDAEQVILPNFDGMRSPRIQFASGSLENPEIRTMVCKVLEGGSVAFRRREEKYALPN